MSPGTEVLDRAQAALLAAIQRPSWQRDALCAEYPDLAWVPDKGADTSRQREICGRCAVRAECFAYAVENDERGIWGGTTYRQRQALGGAARRRIEQRRARDERIRELRDKGLPLRAIAAEVGVSTMTVRNALAA